MKRALIIIDLEKGFITKYTKNICGSHSDPALHKAALKIIANNIGKVK